MIGYFEAEHTREQSAIERQRTIKYGNEYDGERIHVIQWFEWRKKYAVLRTGSRGRVRIVEMEELRAKYL